MDPTNLVGSGSRDSLRKIGAGSTLVEHSLMVYTIAENVKTHKNTTGPIEEYTISIGGRTLQRLWKSILSLQAGC